LRRLATERDVKITVLLDVDMDYRRVCPVLVNGVLTRWYYIYISIRLIRSSPTHVWTTSLYNVSCWFMFSVD